MLTQSEKGSGGHSSEIKFYLIDIAPAPILSWFVRFNDRMLGRMKMLGRMFVLRRIAATHMPAGHAQSQVDPNITHLQTLFAAAGMRLHILNLVGMFTVFHVWLSST